MRNAIMTVVAALLCIVVAELVLRLATSPWNFLDPRTDAFWTARLKNLPASYPWAEKNRIEFDPQLGWRMKRDYSSADARHDGRGFRVHQVPAREGNRPRIFMIGDSFTYGWGVADHETIAAQLQRLSGVKVINAGVNGFGVDQAYLMWELEGRRERPEVVVLGYFLDDFFRNLLSVREAPKPYLVAEGRSYRFAGIPVPAFEAWATAADGAPSLRLLDAAAHVTLKLRRHMQAEDPLYAEAAGRSRYLLQALRDSVAATGARLVVVLIPHCWRGKDLDLSVASRSIRKTCEDGQVPLLNLTEIGQTGEFFGDRCHWNANGHRIAAEKLFDMLTREGLLR